MTMIAMNNELRKELKEKSLIRIQVFDYTKVIKEWEILLLFLL